jgi:hypothetical protein
MYMTLYKHTQEMIGILGQILKGCEPEKNRMPCHQWPF